MPNLCRRGWSEQMLAGGNRCCRSGGLVNKPTDLCSQFGSRADETLDHRVQPPIGFQTGKDKWMSCRIGKRSQKGHLTPTVAIPEWMDGIQL